MKQLYGPPYQLPVRQLSWLLVFILSYIEKLRGFTEVNMFIHDKEQN